MEQTGNGILGRNIVIAVIGFQIIQAAVYTGVILYFGIWISMNWIFFSISVFFHIILGILLYAFQDMFRIEPSGGKLTRINIANLLTIFRLTSIPTISIFLLLRESYPITPVILVFIILAFITDFIDGMLSRRTNQVTQIGKMLDSISDYSILFVVSLVFLYYTIIPFWFFLLLFIRLAFQTAAIAIIVFRAGIVKPMTSFMGKAAVFATMVLFALEVTKLLNIPYLGNITFVTYFEYLVAVIIAGSLIDKISLLGKVLRANKSA